MLRGNTRQGLTLDILGPTRVEARGIKYAGLWSTPMRPSDRHIHTVCLLDHAVRRTDIGKDITQAEQTYTCCLQTVCRHCTFLGIGCNRLQISFRHPNPDPIEAAEIRTPPRGLSRSARDARYAIRESRNFVPDSTNRRQTSQQALCENCPALSDTSVGTTGYALHSRIANGKMRAVC